MTSQTLGEMSFKVSVGTLKARVAGPADGRLVILLHGFPEFWYGWRKQIPALASAGFHVVALDQRGYNESSKPAHVRDYAIPELCADVLAVADALGREHFYLAGHDWGGIVAWELAMRNPERIRRMAILNAPHPAAARRFLTTTPRQMLRSWYVLFFQLPNLPERLFSAREFQVGLASLQTTSAEGAFSPEDLKHYQTAWGQPGAVKSMINWYRALARYSRREHLAPQPVQVPTRILWGTRDQFLLRELAHASLRYCKQGDLIELEEATHWLQHEQPFRVNAALMDWFRG